MISKYYNKFEIISLLIITFWGLLKGEVTVFYIIYLFWFQEFIRIVVDFVFGLIRPKTIPEKILFAKSTFGSFFLQFVYFVFILILFGFILNWNDQDLILKNFQILMFQNWFFNSNLLIFFFQHIYFRSQADNSNLQLSIFRRRHIVLHISILLGAFIQMLIIPKFNIEGLWGSVLIISPFLLLRILIDRKGSFLIK
ncbi:MAG TPA: hypothetical protein VLZ83_16805 [Edaphocola sp.]|nr:hypothetical protein [Edaphocola sp.]